MIQLETLASIALSRRSDVSSFERQLEKVKNESGFIAALDQSGGSTPKALGLYGVDASEYNGDDEMYAKVHEMRTRIMTSPSFGGDRILGDHRARGRVGR